LLEISDWECDAIEILDKLKNNTVVKVTTLDQDNGLLQVNQERLVSLIHTMASSFSQGPARRVHIDDRIRWNDESPTDVRIHGFDSDALEILDALKNNTVVKHVHIYDSETRLPKNQEAYDVKLSEVMKCNKSVESFTIDLESSKINQVFAIMATSGWSSIQELVLQNTYYGILTLREAEHLYQALSSKARASEL
jgi:hypothetical protein